MRNAKIWLVGIAFVPLFAHASRAFDTCIHVDDSDEVLRLNPSADAAELTLGDGSVVKCSIEPSPATGAISSGTCLDRPDETFAVFPAASVPDLDEDDLLVFRNKVWYLRCAFTR